MTEVDSYPSLCFCGSLVDISNDGGTVVSTEGVQVRIADGGGARELLRLASGEITSLVITGNGQTVYFLVRRDTATSDGATPLPRGIWAIDADGANLRQVIDAGDVAGALSLPIEETGCCFHGDGHPLDASDDGGRIVFAAFAGRAEHVFSADGSGGNLVQLRGDLQYAMRVAISGDGALAAYDGTPAGATLNEVAVISAGRRHAARVDHHALLRIRRTVPAHPNRNASVGQLQRPALRHGHRGIGAAGNVDHQCRGKPRSSADRRASARHHGRRGPEQFLYVMRTVRCADCANAQEQLATLALDPVDLGEAPFITDASIDPDSIALDHGSDATVTATVQHRAGRCLASGSRHCSMERSIRT